MIVWLLNYWVNWMSNEFVEFDLVGELVDDFVGCI